MMNERIRELVAQFGPVATISNWGKVEWLDNVYPQLGDVMYADVDLQNFAKLIVRECVGVVEGGSFLHDQAPTAIFARECSGAIKRHFGVEDDQA